MGGFIILADGRAFAPSNFAYDRYIEEIARFIPVELSETRFRDWLLLQRCSVKGSGLGNVDLRSLPEEDQKSFREAAERAYSSLDPHSIPDQMDQSYYTNWIEGFRRLLKMWESIDKGEPPDILNDLSETI